MSTEDITEGQEEEQQPAESEQPDFLGMSDEEFAEMGGAYLDPASYDQEADDESEAEGEEAAASDADADDDDNEDGEGTDDAQEPDTSEDDLDEEAAEGYDNDPDDNDWEDTSADADGAADDTDGEDASDTDNTEDSDKTDVNFEEVYKKITSPFKANGKMMQVDNPDDVVRLMQMGANYNRKMAALKPNLKVMKMLEKNQLLDENKLSFLIDLDKKNPAAIAKLLKESNIDPVDMDLETGDEYKASNYTVDDREIDLDSVIDSIKDTDTYNQTLEVVGTKWDAQSKQIVANEPQLLQVINDHMASGVYDLISTEVEKERMFNRLEGVSDLEAYRIVGDRLHEEGKFAALAEGPAQTPPQKRTPAPEQKKAAKDTRDKRRAASPAKKASSSEAAEDFNPLSLSDDEYMKKYAPNLL